MRSRASSILLAVGAGLLALTLAQYGYMAARQHRLEAAALSAMAGPAPARDSAAFGPTRLVIPKIGMDDAVVAGTTYADLLEAPGWMPSTPPPGEAGNSAIAGHRDTFFRHVADLRKGDAIEVDRGGRRYGFVVKQRAIVRPSDVAVLAPTSTPTLTLITCYPTYWVGPAPKRLIVHASLAWVMLAHGH